MVDTDDKFDTMAAVACYFYLAEYNEAEMTMGQLVMGRGSNGSTILDGSRGSWVKARESKIHNYLLLLLLLLLQNLYNAQIQACSSGRRWCHWVGKWTSRGA